MTRSGLLLLALALASAHTLAQPATDAQASATRAPATTPYGEADRAADAPWRTAARQRIEQHRKAELVIRVLDADGRPVADREVRVEQRRHAFDFGSVFRDENLRRSARALAAQGPASPEAAYAHHFLRLFNAGVHETGLKWSAWERNPATRAAADWSLGWARENRVHVRGHTLIWPDWEMPKSGWKLVPPSLRAFEKQPELLHQKILEHIESTARYYRGNVWCWDVINEPVSWGGILRSLGEESGVEWLQAARRGDPDAVLVVNGPYPETHGLHRWAFERLVRDWRQHGAPVDAIGFQAHFAAHQLTSMPEVLADFQRFIRQGLRIHVTEFSASAADEQLRADYLRDYLTAAFSLPEVDCFILWGFWEGAHFLKDRALYNLDWSPRPAGATWEKLVLDDWWTRATVRTDSNGIARLRVFKGEHLVRSGENEVFCEVGSPGREIRLLVD